MAALRLLADDLTGALDSAAAFSAALGPLRVAWGDAAGASAFDSGTREAGRAAAVARVAALASFFAPEAGRICVFKVDSLLRGHAGAELDAVLKAVPFAHAVIAPAIPAQNRATRRGRQRALIGGAWREAGEDVAATLRGLGHSVALRRPGEALPEGVSLWDAEADADLDAVVAAARAAQGPVLWVGAAGLTAALARSLGVRPVAAPPPGGPLLGLIGTDHAVMREQLARIAPFHLRLRAADDAAAVTGRLRRDGVCFLTADLPPDEARTTARAAIAARFAALLDAVPRPGALFVSGGETLSSVADALGAAALDVQGEIEPGVPLSRLVGGRWDGAPVLSKSGAFGAPDTLARLAAHVSPPTEGPTT